MEREMAFQEAGRAHAKAGMDASLPLRTLTPAHLSEQTTQRLSSASTGIYCTETERHPVIHSIQTQGLEAGMQPQRLPLPLGVLRRESGPTILNSPTQCEASPAPRNKEENFCCLSV